ncbi:hypothetical protein IPZ68_29430 [Streptomyces arenae]|nr:hypothetical protein [Streptomyces arenae]
MSDRALGILGRVADSLGGGQTAAAKLSLIIGLPSAFIAAVAARLSSPAEEILVWLQRGIVSAAILVMVFLFIKNPRHAERPRELTLFLGVSVSLPRGAGNGVLAGRMRRLPHASSRRRVMARRKGRGRDRPPAPLTSNRHLSATNEPIPRVVTMRPTS